MINTWPGWTSEKLLGEGSFGKVYEIRREEFGTIYKAALKVITIPQNPSDIEASYKEGMDQKSVTEYYRSVVEDIVAEFALMSQLKGNSHIVSYEDHQVTPHEDGIGWDIMIRMELLKPLVDVQAERPLDEEQVIKLGIDLCRALELCEKKDIIHRDIKPDNIFVSENGDYKLGDFGIARVIEKTTLGLSKKGTYNYMAPEVYRGDAYGFTVDLYSLGIVMYRFLNGNRTPFLPPAPEAIKYSDKEAALTRRMQGEELPAPAAGSEDLIRIIRKACAFQPSERYQKAEEMRRDLERLQQEVDTGLRQETKKREEKKHMEQAASSGETVKTPSKTKKAAILVAGVTAAVVLLVTIGIITSVRKATRGDREVVAMLEREVDTGQLKNRIRDAEQFDQRLVGTWMYLESESDGDAVISVPNNEMYVFPTGEFYMGWFKDYAAYKSSENGFPQMQAADGTMNCLDAVVQAGNPAEVHAIEKLTEEYGHIRNLSVTYEFFELSAEETGDSQGAIIYAEKTADDGLRMYITGEYSENAIDTKKIDMTITWRKQPDQENYRLIQDMTGTWKDDSGIRWAILYNPYSDEVKYWFAVEDSGTLTKGDSFYIDYELDEDQTDGNWVMKLRPDGGSYVSYEVEAYDGFTLVLVDETGKKRTLVRE